MAKKSYYVPVNPKTIESYRKKKIKLLTKHMGIRLTPEQKLRFQNLTTEIQIDNYARTVMDHAWDE